MSLPNITHNIVTFKDRLDRRAAMLNLSPSELIRWCLRLLPWEREPYDKERIALYERCVAVYKTAEVSGLQSHEVKVWERLEGEPHRERCASLYAKLEKKLRDKYKGTFEAFSPCIYKKGITTRGGASVFANTALVYDYDEGEFTYSSIRQTWEGIGVEFAIHSSSSHTKERHKLRVIIPLAEPCPPEVWDSLWLWGFEYSKRLADPATKDRGRIYYRRYEGFDPYSRPVASHVYGWLLEWRDLPLEDYKPEPKPKTKRVAPRTSNGQTYETPTEREALGLALGGRVTSGGRAIRGVRCPACGDNSVWFWIVTDGQLKATCNHIDSCGGGSPQTFWLDELK